MVEFDAFVLTGGTSARMGRDKALIEIDGVAMAKRVVQSLERAGAANVRCVGGDRNALESLGLEVLDDLDPRAGPLGGVVAALRASRAPVALVSPCDLIAPPVDGYVALVTALARTPPAQVSVASSGGQWRPLPCAVRSTAVAELGAAFAAGERAVHRALALLTLVEVDAGSFTDADSPGDLPGHR